ncbi:putative DNA excision repair protein [Tricharina praecox]|uniref:putative DNA excision repair protein n=1 Tax=Tricharina praecox TaxID=43433 RepID=UPI00221EBCB4|nr:putative DNA excision repair protein [Tricharina praecox]KAI5842765.1 putative DNA excision repair protein [Tricharina praecox]
MSTAASASDSEFDLDYAPAAPSKAIAKAKRKRTPAPPSPDAELDAVPLRTTAHPSGSGARIMMTDDSEDDVVLAAWKRRKSAAACKPKQKKKASRAGKKTTKPSPAERIVGRTAAGAAGRKQPPLTWNFTEDRATTGDGVRQDDEVVLPQYLLPRKAAVQRAREEMAQGRAPTLGGVRLPPSWDDVVFSDDERLGELESRPHFGGVVKPCAPYADIVLPDSLGVVPCSIAQYLRGYQVDGVRFLHRCFVLQEGCILGDDMGLGKTVQIIAFLTAAFGKTGDSRDAKRMRKARRAGGWYPRVLVICPSSLIANWCSEFKTWGWWEVYVYHGSKEDKEMALRAAMAGSAEVVITNYETYRLRHMEVNLVEWDAVIADECHKIKERSSQTTQRMNEINSLCRIGLTGTAIQNKYEELWTLLNWCRPGQVGTVADWERTISGPLRIGQTHNATVRQLGKARKVALMLVNNLLPRMFLRRMKTLIAHQLPKKSDKIVFCPLTETQKEAYMNFTESEMVRLIRDASDPCACGSGKKRRICCHREDSQGRRINELVFPAIMWTLKLSNHLANWVPDDGDTGDVRAQKLELLETCLPGRWKELSTRERMYNYMDPQMCGKWIVLERLLKFWYANGDKVLIFSYSLNLLHILHALFRRTDYNVCYLDGGMPLGERAKAVDDFNSDPDQFVFLISTKAGGVGLNITAANKVVIFDPNWNPAYDLQAQDRAYRIGQTRDVEVFRLISTGTIEEIVYARQVYKQQQASIGYNASVERRYFTGVMGDKTNKGELFGLKNLFTFQENTILQEIVNKTNIAERKAGVMVADMDGSADEADETDDVIPADEEAGVLQVLTRVAGDLDDLGVKPTRKPKPLAKNNPIAAILADAGVSYTHENSEVVGTSKIEELLSRRAVESASHDTQSVDKPAFFDDDDDDYGDEDRVRYKFKPPTAVRKRQFCTAAKMFGFSDVREFALVVEGWSQAQRTTALNKFYQMRREGGEKDGKGVEDEADAVVALDAVGAQLIKEAEAQENEPDTAIPAPTPVNSTAAAAAATRTEREASEAANSDTEDEL